MGTPEIIDYRKFFDVKIIVRMLEHMTRMPPGLLRVDRYHDPMRHEDRIRIVVSKADARITFNDLEEHFPSDHLIAQLMLVAG